MADGSLYPTKLRLTNCILDFIEGYGAAGASFIADFYRLDHQVVSKRCTVMVLDGRLVRWFFDGIALYGLPENAPEPEILNAPRQPGRGRRSPRRKKQS